MKFNELICNPAGQIVFENNKSSEVLSIPQSAKDFVTVDFHGPDYGEPASSAFR